MGKSPIAIFINSTTELSIARAYTGDIYTGVATPMQLPIIDALHPV